jgi:hypothetical protein
MKQLKNEYRNRSFTSWEYTEDVIPYGYRYLSSVYNSTMISMRIRNQHFYQCGSGANSSDLMNEKLYYFTVKNIFITNPPWRASFLQDKPPDLESEHPAPQNIHFLTVSYYLGSLFPTLIRIRIPIADPDPADPNQCGSGSTSLLSTYCYLYTWYRYLFVQFEVKASESAFVSL